MGVTQKANQWADENRGLTAGAGIVMLLIGIFLLTGVIQLPSMQGMPFATAATGNQVDIDVDKKTGLPLFKTVGVGADEVEYEINWEAAAKDEYRLKVIGLADRANTGSARFTVDGNGDTLSAGNTRSITGPYTVFSEGESRTSTLLVDTQQTEDGDRYEFSIRVETTDGATVGGPINKEVKVQRGSGTLTATVVGTAFSALGGLALLLAA